MTDLSEEAEGVVLDDKVIVLSFLRPPVEFKIKGSLYFSFRISCSTSVIKSAWSTSASSIRKVILAPDFSWGWYHHYLTKMLSVPSVLNVNSPIVVGAVTMVSSALPEVGAFCLVIQ